MPRRKRYPYVHGPFFDDTGRFRIYLRKPGLPRISLRGPYGGPEFLE